MSADKLSARAILCIFLGFPPDVPGWQFYHPTSRHVLPSQDVTFDESDPHYRLFPYRSAPPPPPPLFLARGPPPVADDLGAARGAATGGVESGGAEPGGAASEGAGSGGAEPGGAEPGGAEPAGVEPGGAESEGAEFGGAVPQGTASSRGPAGASPRLSPRPEPLSLQQLREWFTPSEWSYGAGDSAAGDTGAGCVGATRLGCVGVTAGAGGTGGAAAAGPGGARTKGTKAAETGSVGGAGAGGARARGTGAGGAGAGGAGAGDTGAVDPGAGGARAGGAVSGSTIAGGTVRLRPFFVPLASPGSPLHAPSPYAEQTDSLTERCEPEPRPASPVSVVCSGRRVPRPRPPPVPGTHAMALRPSSVPLRVPLSPPSESSLPAIPDPESDLARAASPTVSLLLATVVTDPSFESTAVSVLIAQLVDFTTTCMPTSAYLSSTPQACLLETKDRVYED
ncbi:unnamed protein product [Closterium sp. NIES-54]